MATVDSSPSFGMKMIIRTLKSRWSAVSNVTTDTLHKWIEGEEKKSLVILDARNKEEYEVSHVKDALWVDPQAKDLNETLQQIKKMYPGSSEVNSVSYCSLGYRGSLYADAIQKAMSNKPDDMPMIKPFNLEGGLFKWANEGRTMVDSQERPTKMAHPCNGIWGKFLNAELRSNTPGDAN